MHRSAGRREHQGGQGPARGLLRRSHLLLPEVPTAKEQGFDVQVTQYRFLTAPKGTPEEAKAVSSSPEEDYATAEYKKFNGELPHPDGGL